MTHKYRTITIPVYILSDEQLIAIAQDLIVCDRETGENNESRLTKQQISAELRWRGSTFLLNDDNTISAEAPKEH